MGWREGHETERTSEEVDYGSLRKPSRLNVVATCSGVPEDIGSASEGLEVFRRGY